MKTTLISLKDEAKTRELIIDEAFWDNVIEICFESTCIRFRMKSGEVKKIMHHWFYEAVNDPTNSELDKYHLYKRESCEYHFPKENKAFLDWIWEEAKKEAFSLNIKKGV